jgi:hypothetical protein
MNPEDTMIQPPGRGPFSRRAGPCHSLKPVQVILSEDLTKRLDNSATERGYNSRSEMVRAACEAFLLVPEATSANV